MRLPSRFWVAWPSPAAAGLGFYTLNGDQGILYRFSGPNYSRVDQALLGRKVNWLTAVPASLVVTVADANEMWTGSARALCASISCIPTQSDCRLWS